MTLWAATAAHRQVFLCHGFHGFTYATQIAAGTLARGLLSSSLGILLGLAVAFNATALVNMLLHRVEATDSVSFAGAVSLLILVALAAAQVPAHRAARTDPIEILKAE